MFDMQLPPPPPPGLSVVIPVYNSEGSLRPLIERLLPVLEQIAPGRHEVIFVNDGSPDGSWGVVQALADEHDRVTGINLLRNYGQHNALLCGLRAAGYDTLVTMDDDLQHPPEELPHLLDKLAEGFDVVYGYPAEEQHGLWRDLASQFTKIALRSTTGVEAARHVSAFRAFRTRLRRAFESYSGPFVSLDVLLTWGTTRFAAVPVRHDPRTIGESNYTFRKLVRHALNMMTGFSTLPLKLASVVGFGLTVFGIGVLLYVIVRTLTERAAPAGFPFLASIIAIFSGAQLFALGMMGEYLARMHFRLMDRPTYTVEARTPPPDAS